MKTKLTFSVMHDGFEEPVATVTKGMKSSDEIPFAVFNSPEVMQEIVYAGEQFSMWINDHGIRELLNALAEAYGRSDGLQKVKVVKNE